MPDYTLRLESACWHATANAGGVLANLKSRTPEISERLTDYLRTVVPEITGVDSIAVGNRRALEFRCRVRSASSDERYFADSMSDGTLHVLGVLLALFQNAGVAGGGHVVGIEEPETALHLDAAGVLTDVLLDASQRAQVIVTTHSADLLDRDELVPVDSMLPMVSADGESKIGPLDEVGRSVVREGTFTAGELLRIDQLHPDPRLAAPQRVTCSVGPELGVHPGHCRRRRQSAGSAGAASADSAGSCACQSSADLDTYSRPSLKGDQAGSIGSYVGRAAQRAGFGGGVLILLDANGDCPARLGPVLLERARAARPDRRIAAVLASREYEAWFLASIESIAGSRTLSGDLTAPPAPESVRGAKEWLSQRMQVPYRPLTDQPALTARFDMALARRRSPSFDKLWRAASALLTASSKQRRAAHGNAEMQR